MAEGWTTESVLKKHGLWRELAGPLAGPTAIKLQWQDMQLEKLRAENQKVRELTAMISDPRQWVQNEWTQRIAKELRCILDLPDQPSEHMRQDKPAK